MAKKKVKKDFGIFLERTGEGFSDKNSRRYDRKLAALWTVSRDLGEKNKIDPTVFMSTPSGRRFLRSNFNKGKKVGISENDILKFAFIAELLQINISFEDASALLMHGITLRDIKHKKPEDLAAQRWNFVSHGEKSGEFNDARTIRKQLNGLGIAGDLENDWDIYSERLGDEKSLPTTAWLESNRKKEWEKEFRNWKTRTELASLKNINLNQVEYYDLLVLSDFHLAAGNHPAPEGIARFSPTEDFYFDDAFFRFLYFSQMERLQRGGYPYELVFNGDMADFAQIVVPENVTENRNPLIPWPLPPLRRPFRNEDNTSGMYNRTEEVLPTRLFRILRDVYGRSDLNEATKEQIELLHDLEDSASAHDLNDVLDSISRKKADSLSANGSKSFTDPPFIDPKMNQEIRQRTDAYIEEKHYRDRDYSRARVLAMQRDKALGQLADLYHGHHVFFQALAWFIAQGNRLVLMRGNHDPQWYWPEVQMAFIGWLHKAYTELHDICKHGKYEFPVSTRQMKRRFPAMTIDDFERRVDFNHAWFYYRDRLVFIEHGGQQEAVDCHRYFLLPVYSARKEDGKGRSGSRKSAGSYKHELFPQASTWLSELKVSPHEAEIEPPLGSLGLVYLINNIETQLPNFDLPAYKKTILNYLRYENPLILTSFMKGLWRTIKTLVRWALLPFKEVLVFNLKQLGRLKLSFSTWQSAIHEQKIKAYASLTGLPLACVQELDRTRWVRSWRKLISGWILTLLNAILSLLLVCVPLAIIYISADELITGSSFLDTLEGIVNKVLPFVNLDFNPPDRDLRFWDYLWSALKAFGFAFFSFWLLKGLRDWIGLGEDYLREPAQKVAEKLSKVDRDVPYIIYGHDHVRNAQLLKSIEKIRKEESRSWYINTGTWLFKYEKDRKRLYREDHEYPFLRMIDTHKVLASSTKPDIYLQTKEESRPIVQLLRWNDSNLKVESCETFKGLD